MSAFAMVLLQAASVTAPGTTQQAADAVDWAKLPAFPWRVPPRYDPAMTRFVSGEIAAGRCHVERDSGGALLVVEVAVQVDADGGVGAVRPRAIGCATVEQYTAGIVSRMARDNIDPAALHGAGWYRVVTTYTWRG